MERFRLDAVAPIVGERFRRAASSKRRQAVYVACEGAVAAVSLAEPEVSAALAILRGAATTDVTLLRSRLESLSAGFDDEYFRLEEDGGASQRLRALHCFSKARAASALAFALDDSKLHEAIYESISALEDPAALVRLVERTLE